MKLVYKNSEYAANYLNWETIECSKDYTDIKSDDVLEQIAQYISETISDIFHDPICFDTTFTCNASGGGSKGSDGCYEFGESNYRRYAGGGSEEVIF